jgi:O-antigen/teichoic acid export membrane protein
MSAARHDVGAVLRFSVPLFLSEMLKKFRSEIQTILLGALYTMSSVGVFTVANKINVVSRISSYSLMTSAEPAFAELHERQDSKQMGELYRATSRWMFVLNFPVVLVMALFAEPLLSIFGESFVSGASALILLSLASLVNIATGLGGTIIDMTGYTKLKLVNSVAQITLFIVTSVLFIPPWGVVGAATAAMVSSSIIQISRMAQVAYLFKLQPYDRWFAKAAAGATVTCLLGLLMRSYFATGANLFIAGLEVVALLGVYVVSILLFGLAPQDRAIAGSAFRRTRSLLWGHKAANVQPSTGDAD